MDIDDHEQHRLAALARYAVIGTLPETTFDRLALLATQFFHAPIALISLVDEQSQFFKACLGLDLRSTDRSLSFCAHALQSGKVLIVPDATLDARFADNALVTGHPHIRFYAGAPLETPDGYRLGTLCIIDSKPRKRLTVRQQSVLQDLAALVMDELELRLRTLELEREAQANQQLLRALKQEQRYGQSLLSLSSLLSLDLPPLDVIGQALELISEAVQVDWGSLVAVKDREAQTVTTWFNTSAGQAFNAVVPQRASPGQGNLWQVIERGVAEYTNEYSSLPEANSVLIDSGLRAAAWLPLGQYDETQYIVMFSRLNRAEAWSAADCELLAAASRTINTALAERNRHRLLEQAALSDPLTGLGNRRALDVALAAAPPPQLQLALLDLDGFKGVNDREGHERGDVLLRLFSSALMAELRPDTKLYRLGGDEFVVLDLKAERPQAEAWERDMLAAVDAAIAAVRLANFGAVAASVGMAAGWERGAASEIMKLADQRMYSNKRSRRERLLVGG